MSNNENTGYIEQLEAQLSKSESEKSQVQAVAAQSMYQTNQDNNLIQYQLETSEILSRIEHYLKGEILAIDKHGNEYYAKQKNSNLVTFNEYGVSSIMSIIGNYIDKNTILSYYNEERINEILADLGDKLATFIYCNYEKIGMDTEYKKSRFDLIVLNILHIVESSYRRALGGKEREEINSSRIFTQFDHMRPNVAPSAPKRKFNLLKPHTW